MNHTNICKATLIALACLATACSSSGDGDSVPSRTFDLSDGTYRGVSVERALVNGSIRVFNFLYTDEGLLVGQLVTLDGEPESTVSYSYNENIQLATREDDTNSDGVTDKSRVYRHDGASQRIGVVFDNNGDGVADRVYEYVFSADGYISSLNIRVVNGSPADVSLSDGEIIATRDFIYDMGRQVQTVFDTDNDGVIDSTSDFQYDTLGRLTTVLNQRIDGEQGFVDVWSFENLPCIRSWMSSTELTFCAS